MGVRKTADDQLKQRENVLKKNPNGPAWPVFTEDRPLMARWPATMAATWPATDGWSW